MDRLLFVFLLAILNTGRTLSATPGVYSCKVQTQSGLVDLTPLGYQDGTPRFRSKPEHDTGYIYYWNPCFDFSESASCQNVELCQHDVPQDYNLGSDATAKFVDNNTHLFMVYEAKDYVTRKSFIQLICDAKEEGVFEVIGENPQTVYHFTLRSKYACPSQQTTPTGATPTSTPSPSPVISLKTITILLGCIFVSLCLLICQVFVGLITRRSEEDTSSYEEKKRKF